VYPVGVVDERLGDNAEDDVLAELPVGAALLSGIGAPRFLDDPRAVGFVDEVCQELALHRLTFFSPFPPDSLFSFTFRNGRLPWKEIYLESIMPLCSKLITVLF